jgi:hypothetical protein
MCSKSNPIVVFALDLMSTYEGEHTIFGLLYPGVISLKAALLLEVDAESPLHCGEQIKALLVLKYY